MQVIGRLHDLKEGKALLVGTYVKERDGALADLNELESLCGTYGLKVAAALPCPRRKMNPGLFLGKGKVEEIIFMHINFNCSAKNSNLNIG
jgi:50S ribosomal subunit-associated GTPase HflX